MSPGPGKKIQYENYVMILTYCYQDKQSSFLARPLQRYMSKHEGGIMVAVAATCSPQNKPHSPMEESTCIGT
jgi:hypothetical protein